MLEAYASPRVTKTNARIGTSGQAVRSQKYALRIRWPDTLPPDFNGPPMGCASTHTELLTIAVRTFL